jgi:glutathione peroxidase
MTIYDFSIRKRDGSEIPMADYRGKILLIVNTATGCGFTPQYRDLQEIYEKYSDKGLEILDFPCNQFANQAPGNDDEIHTFCTGRFGITFPQFAKIDVNGENASPLYRWLTANSRFDGFGKGIKAKMLNLAVKANEKGNGDENAIKWNFTKFLIDREGNMLGRFEPTTDMKTVEEKVKEAIG